MINQRESRILQLFHEIKNCHGNYHLHRYAPNVELMTKKLSSASHGSIFVTDGILKYPFYSIMRGLMIYDSGHPKFAIYSTPSPLNKLYFCSKNRKLLLHLKRATLLGHLIPCNILGKCRIQDLGFRI